MEPQKFSPKQRWDVVYKKSGTFLLKPENNFRASKLDVCEFFWNF